MGARCRCHYADRRWQKYALDGPPLSDESINLIVASPHSVLLDEQSQKAVDAGLRAASFKLSKHPSKDTQILFVQVEHVSQKVCWKVSEGDGLHLCI
jgi:hypothetical protein